jgi:hypothetical protein
VTPKSSGATIASTPIASISLIIDIIEEGEDYIVLDLAS